MTNTEFIITDITPEKRRQLALITLKHRLRLEIKTGMSTSGRVGLVEYCRKWGYEGNRSKMNALNWVISQLPEEHRD